MGTNFIWIWHTTGTKITCPRETKRQVIAGVKVQLEPWFSATVPARVVNEFNAWTNKLIYALDAAGVDAEINYVFRGNSAGHPHYTEIRLKKESELPILFGNFPNALTCGVQNARPYRLVSACGRRRIQTVPLAEARRIGNVRIPGTLPPMKTCNCSYDSEACRLISRRGNDSKASASSKGNHEGIIPSFEPSLVSGNFNKRRAVSNPTGRKSHNAYRA